LRPRGGGAAGGVGAGGCGSGGSCLAVGLRRLVEPLFLAALYLHDLRVVDDDLDRTELEATHGVEYATLDVGLF
jgi:hypothetical protein